MSEAHSIESTRRTAARGAHAERSTEASSATSWFDERAVEPLVDINAQCLGLLADLARAEASPVIELPPIVADLREAWHSQGATELQALALYPCSLVDAGFADSLRWQSVQRGVVHESLRPHPPGCFEAPEHQDFVRRVLVYGWHLARAHRQMARIVLGMTPQSAQCIATLRLQDLDLIARRHASWVRPRWEAQPRIWRQILSGTPGTQRSVPPLASLRGLQLLAAGTFVTR